MGTKHSTADEYKMYNVERDGNYCCAPCCALDWIWGPCCKFRVSHHCCTCNECFTCTNCGDSCCIFTNSLFYNSSGGSTYCRQPSWETSSEFSLYNSSCQSSACFQGIYSHCRLLGDCSTELCKWRCGCKCCLCGPMLKFDDDVNPKNNKVVPFSGTDPLPGVRPRAKTVSVKYTLVPGSLEL